MPQDSSLIIRIHTQSGLQQLNITPFRAALLAHLIICAIMGQPLACAASRPGPIAAQLSLSTQYASYPLRLRLCIALGVGSTICSAAVSARILLIVDVRISGWLLVEIVKVIILRVTPVP
jgi:hypothetical protein